MIQIWGNLTARFTRLIKLYNCASKMTQIIRVTLNLFHSFDKVI